MLDEEADGCAGGDAVEHAGEHLYHIGFVACGGKVALSRTPAAHLVLQEFGIHLHSGRHAVYHTADSGTVAFAESGEPKEVSDGVHASMGVCGENPFFGGQKGERAGE